MDKYVSIVISSEPPQVNTPCFALGAVLGEDHEKNNEAITTLCASLKQHLRDECGAVNL